MSHFAALLLRGVIAAFAGLLFAGGTLTLAADRAAVQRPTLVSVAAKPSPLTVPQVTGQAYVFAKGILQDSGFAWHVAGSVKGYAGNTVVDQQPAAGTVVLDTGAPLVTLTLGSNPAYVELGTPENNAPYRGTAVRLPANPLARRVVAPRLAERFPAASSAKRPAKRAARPKSAANRRSTASKTS
jgi:PASTA domain-containing protein